MNKAELISAIASQVEVQITKKQIEAVVTSTFDAIQNAVATGDKVTLVGFGSFEPRDRAERQGRNPKTGEALIIPASKAIGFSAGKAFKSLVNGDETE